MTAERPDLFDRDADPETWSNLEVGGQRLTWREAAEHNAQRAQDAERLVSLLLDLDRCEHGRHEGDDCVGCEGPSRGNPVIGMWHGWHERRIGTTYGPAPIFVPTGRFRDYDAWTTEPDVAE